MSKSSSKRIRVYNALQPELFSIDKGGNAHTRVVWRYDDDARQKQREALRAMRTIQIPMPLATGSVPGMTLYDNVAPHRKSVKFYTTDFIDAFGSVQQEVMEEKVKDILRRYAPGRNHKEARDTIRAYVEDGAFLAGVPGLPQGNVTSQDLFNWYMKDADSTLAYLLWKRRRDEGLGEFATRYLDDLTVSSRVPNGVGAPLRQSVRNIYENLAPGMKVSHPKSRVRHLNEEHPAITITGLSIYRDGRITPSPTLLSAAREVFDEASRKLAEGERVSEEDFWQVAGYNGVMQLPGESGYSASRRVREMGATAKLLMSQMKPHQNQ